MTFTRLSGQIRITEDPGYSETTSRFSFATASTALMISSEISENFIGDLSPLKFAEVETNGLFSLPINFLR